MKCPICNEDMEFEEAKNWHGTWYCECGYEANGSHVPCDAEYFTDSPSPVVCDYEDAIENECPKHGKIGTSYCTICVALQRKEG